MYVILKMKGDYNMDNIFMDYINEFRNDNYYLSNFYECPVTYDGLTYRNNEAAFQAQKCINPKDREQFTTLNPSEAKKFGRRVVLRKDWEDIKVIGEDTVLVCLKRQECCTPPKKSGCFRDLFNSF